jgi:hypothetical protein
MLPRATRAPVNVHDRSSGAIMGPRSLRRLPLRDLLTDAEKRTRDLIEQVHVTLLSRTSDLRELSRPVRKRSHFPTVHALLNAMEKLSAAADETEERMSALLQELEEIRDHARRELSRRI